jgi:hypothetical protein
MQLQRDFGPRRPSLLYRAQANPAAATPTPFTAPRAREREQRVAHLLPVVAAPLAFQLDATWGNKSYFGGGPRTLGPKRFRLCRDNGAIGSRRIDC